MSRLQKYLNELWVKNTYSRKKFEVLKNPSLKSMKSILSSTIDVVRFIADNTNKKLYVWNSNEAIHNDVWNNPQIKKGRDFDSASCDEILYGIAASKGNKFIMYDSNGIKTGIDIPTIIKKFKWVNKHIKIDKYLNSIW